MGIMDSQVMTDQVKVFLSSCTTRDLYRLMWAGFEELEVRGEYFCLLKGGPEMVGLEARASAVSGRLVGSSASMRKRVPRVSEAPGRGEGTNSPAGSDPHQPKPV